MPRELSNGGGLICLYWSLTFYCALCSGSHSATSAPIICAVLSLPKSGTVVAIGFPTAVATEQHSEYKTLSEIHKVAGKLWPV